MAVRSLSTRTPVHWILDWDGTVTKKDTLDALVNIAASSKPSFPILDKWKKVVDAYIHDYHTTLSEFTPRDKLPVTIEGEKKLLKDLRPVEQRSLDRVFDCRIFRGLTMHQLEEGARKAIHSGEVAFRYGYMEFMGSLPHAVVSHGDTFHILSVNWSRHFIFSCLKAADIKVEKSLIWANELQGILDGKPSSGEITPEEEMKIVASNDKLQYLKNMKADREGRIIYVGDSWTDIECLFAADIGICIRDEPMPSSQMKLASALERLGVNCPHLSDWTTGGGSQVVWARDFSEVQKWTEELYR